MSRYIDADKLLKAINENVAEAHNERCSQLLEAILNAPTADVAEVVRCKDCVSSRPLNRNDRFEARYSDGCIYCMRTDEGVAKDDYCSYGERRENGTH